MLILKRRVGESILIGDNVEVKVLGWCSGQIKFGINAPKDVKILRDELLDRERQQRFVGHV